MSNIGSRIEELIRILRITQKDFAEKINASPQTISNWKKSDPDFQKVKSIIETFPEINARWFITGEGEPFIEKDGRELEIELKLRKRIDELQQELLDNFRNNRKD